MILIGLQQPISHKEMVNKMKIWNKEEIIKILEENDFAVGRAIVAIYEYQTSEEKMTASTKNRNGVGFSGCDARMGTWIAKEILQSGRNKDFKLYGHVLYKARKMAKKYAGQLTDIANENERKKEDVKNGVNLP
jgi:hypothetical protein